MKGNRKFNIDFFMNTIYEIAQESMGLTNGNGLNNQQSDIEVMSDFINTAISNRADEVSAITLVRIRIGPLGNLILVLFDSIHEWHSFPDCNLRFSGTPTKLSDAFEMGTGPAWPNVLCVTNASS
jgi:hypothetical protein